MGVWESRDETGGEVECWVGEAPAEGAISIGFTVTEALRFGVLAFYRDA